MIWISLLLLALAILPLAMTWKNLAIFRRATNDEERLKEAEGHPVSIVIPARNEEGSIESALRSIMNTTHPKIEVLVLDDASEDRTGEIVDHLSQSDGRIKRLTCEQLPQGWNGKQHACWVAASSAKYSVLLFVDADVRFSSDAITRCVAQLYESDCPLVSGFPKQETKTWSEQMLIPMMYSLLLGYLPIDRMRASSDAGFAAGCGQLFVANREIYFETGGHSAIRSSRHDGIMLPRNFRRKGYRTDIFDASDLATCRMYCRCSEVVRGLLKNATEGIANVRLILPFTLLLAGANILPVLLICFAWKGSISWSFLILLGAILIGFLPRLLLTPRFDLSLWTVLVQPLTVLWFLSLQWLALVRSLMGRTTSWRGRRDS